MKQFIRRNFRFIPLLCLLAGLTACKKNPSQPDPPVEGPPVVSARGTPNGIAAEQTIGAAGGTLTSVDGLLTITVPPGAVATNTTFSIQPITNTLYNGSDKKAFRLTPEGTTFSKPVEVTYYYTFEDVRNSLPELLTAAYQTAEGSWKAVPGRVNKNDHEYTFKTDHFSDWCISGLMELHVPDRTVAIGETVPLTVTGLTLNTSDDLLAPLTGVFTIEWTLIHRTRGKLEVNAANNAMANFTANRPQSPADNIAEISVKLTGNHIKVRDETLPGGYAVFKQLILLTSIEILGDTYMEGTFMGKINIANVVALGNEIGIGVTGQKDDMLINLNVFGLEPGRYPCGEVFAVGKSQAAVTWVVGNQPRTWGTMYEECGPPRILRYSNGVVTIKKWGRIGEPVEGSFSGTVYLPDGSTPEGCPIYRPQLLDIEFKTVRSL